MGGGRWGSDRPVAAAFAPETIFSTVSVRTVYRDLDRKFQRLHLNRDFHCRLLHTSAIVRQMPKSREGSHAAYWVNSEKVNAR